VRVACLLVPDFPLQALRRSLPELAEAPLAIVAGSSPRDALIAVSAQAAELGAQCGMTAAQVRARAPLLDVRTVPGEVSEAADGALADVAGAFSPRVRRHAPGEVLLDVDGLLPRFGSEETIADALLRAGRRVGLDVRVGVASSPDVARVAARCAADAVVVGAGGERAFVAPLPLELLEPPVDVVLALARWGVASAGELARLPRLEVRLRLGSAGLALHRLACGEPVHDFVPDPVREQLREGIGLEHSVVALEPFLFILHGLLSRLAERLALRGEGFADALVELHLEGGGRHELRVKPVAPSPEVPAVLALARLRLEAHPPGGPVDGVTVTVVPGRVRWVQGALFGAPQPAPAKLAMTLARLAALVGPDRVGAPFVPDGHRPGAWAIAPFAPVNAGERGEGRGESSGRAGERTPNPEPRTTGFSQSNQGGDKPRPYEERPAEVPSSRCPVPGTRCPVLRACRPPRPAQVVAIGGRPVTARLDGLGGTVVGWAGPYRSAGDWWTGEPFSRDDFDVATADGALLRVFFDRLSSRWFVDGIYD